MKRSTALVGLCLLSLVFFTSCHEQDILSYGPAAKDEAVKVRSANYLINLIEVSQNSVGDWEFVGDLQVVQQQVEDIFVTRGDFVSVDEFGFDYTALGTQYFYAVQYATEGARTWFCFLDSSTGAISTAMGGGQPTHGWECENKKCCDKCVAHDSLICTCHSITDDCMTQNPPPTSECTKKTVWKV